MKKKSSHRILATLLLTLFFCFPLYLISRPFGVEIELRRTGGAFPGESLCTNSGCHQDSPADSGPGGLSVTANGTPIHEYEYTPGELVSLMVKISDPSAARWGFQMTARTDDGCLQAGSFAPGEGAVMVLSNKATLAPCPEAEIDFPVHQVAKEGRTGEVTYLVNWTAPAEDIGPIKFAAAGNAANGNNLDTGDHIYTLQATVEPAALPPPPPPTVPAIAPTGVVIANLLPTINAISNESIISIFGSDFAPSGFRDLDTQVDPATGLVATNQSGVCVEIDGQRSPMFHVISNQLNVQAPTLEGAGPVSVVVITNCGTPEEQRSAAELVQLVDRTPAFFLEPFVGDGGQIAALHPDFSIVGDPALRPGSTPAEPGNFISLFGTGFGLTNPDVQAGQIPGNVQEVQDNGFLAPLVGDFSLTIGGMPLEGSRDIPYAGLASCCAGLYQIVVRVPDGLPDGRHMVTAMIDGVSTTGDVFVQVKTVPEPAAPGAGSPEGEEPGGSDVVDDDGSGGGDSSGGEGDGDTSGGGGSGGGDTGGGGGSGGGGTGGDGSYLQIPGAGTRGPTLFPPTSSSRGR